MSNIERRPYVRKLVRNPRDFVGGLALIACALVALWASGDLAGMEGFSFGPGTAPRLFAILLLITGAAVTLIGLFSDGPPLEKWGVRGPVMFIAAIIFFGAAVRPLGLIIAAFGSLLIASTASKESHLIETIAWSAILTAFCVALFVYALNLPMPLWPSY